MEKIVIDGAVLDDLATSLSAIKNDFGSTDRVTADVADAVGHVVLAERVRSFASSWDHRRTELSEQLAALRADVNTIREGFASADADLGGSLRGNG